jgi:hypothetical protein
VNTPNKRSSSQRIGVFAAFSIGFDRIAARPVLILPPIFLDLFLWLGLRLRITEIVADSLSVFSQQLALEPSLEQQLGVFEEMVTQIGNAYNLLSALSSLPIGIPSYMAGRMPLASPLTESPSVEVTQPTQALLVWIGLTLGGIILGTLYHVWIAKQVAPSLSWERAPLAVLRMLAFSILIYLALTLVLMFVLFLSSLATLILPLFGAIVLFLGFTFIFWTGFYLVFAPLGIVRYSLGVFRSMAESLRVIRWNFLSTVGFLLIILGISWIGNVIWNLPDEYSWFTILAVVGHGFVAAVLLTSTYAFYQDRRSWTISDSEGGVLEQAPLSGTGDEG